MGCKPSKAAAPDKSGERKRESVKYRSSQSSDNNSETKTNGKLYQLLSQAQQSNGKDGLLNRVQELSKKPAMVLYQSPNTQSTPLHMAIKLLPVVLKSSKSSVSASDLVQIVEALVEANPNAAGVTDASGNVPLHYCLGPLSNLTEPRRSAYKLSVSLIKILVNTNRKACLKYFRRTDVSFDSLEGTCSPLYRAVWMLPDDSTSPESPTVEYLHHLVRLLGPIYTPNSGNGDTPLALLYRRFTRQFDLAEQFFDGDNSRPEVLQHRQRYKTAAGNTWKHIEIMLRPPESTSGKQWYLVHRAAQVETPPDLLRYIVETNAQDLTAEDENEEGNLPLHYAAAATPSDECCVFYSKYVIDELLYKYPEAASRKNKLNQYPLELAVAAKKSWIGGGIKSLYEAFPDALSSISLENHSELQKALSMDGLLPSSVAAKEEKKDTLSDTSLDNGMADEPHDAIMLVQQPNVDVSQVVGCMWAHEEDAGVQMLGCVAISRLAAAADNTDEIVSLSLSGVPAVVNALKAHPNEVIVQEKACHALAQMAPADGRDEVSLVASGAVMSLVGAMQAHVSDASVQEEASHALRLICREGGAHRATIVASVSGVTALVNALAAHPQERGVQMAAIGALQTVTGFPTASVPSLARSQTESLLMAAQERFPETSEPVEVLLSRLS